VLVWLTAFHLKLLQVESLATCVAEVGDDHSPTNAAAPVVSAAAPIGLGAVALLADCCIPHPPAIAPAATRHTITHTRFMVEPIIEFFAYPIPTRPAAALQGSSP
jgi:hypothetical protein